jgi:hypothetical protein
MPAGVTLYKTDAFATHARSSRPKRNPTQAMEFDRGDHVAFGETHHSASGQSFNLALGHQRIHLQFAGCGRVVFLQHLQGNYERVVPAMLGE